jgi:hypothetical protein
VDRHRDVDYWTVLLPSLQIHILEIRLLVTTLVSSRFSYKHIGAILISYARLYIWSSFHRNVCLQFGLRRYSPFWNRRLEVLLRIFLSGLCRSHQSQLFVHLSVCCHYRKLSSTWDKISKQTWFQFVKRVSRHHLGMFETWIPDRWKRDWNHIQCSLGKLLFSCSTLHFFNFIHNERKF